MRIEYSCPFGHECERVMEDANGPYLNRCRLWQEYDRAVGESDWGCALVWGDVMTSNVQRAVRGVQAATESVRNRMPDAAARARALAVVLDRNQPTIDMEALPHADDSR